MPQDMKETSDACEGCHATKVAQTGGLNVVYAHENGLVPIGRVQAGITIQLSSNGIQTRIHFNFSTASAQHQPLRRTEL